MKRVYIFLISLPILFTLLTSIVFIWVGLSVTYEGIIAILDGHITDSAHPGIKLVDSLDMYMIGFLFLIFALGFAQLFMPESWFFKGLNNITPKWLQVKNFTELKLILWDTILTSLVIVFASEILKRSSDLSWEITIIPIGILMLALSGYFIRKREMLTKRNAE